jgi:hypothetical protein
MMFAIVSEIRLARGSLAQLSPLERRRLLRRIIGAHDALQDAPVSASSRLDWESIDSIILSTSHALGESSSMPDDDFKQIINQFDILFGKLAASLLDDIEPASQQRH